LDIRVERDHIEHKRVEDGARARRWWAPRLALSPLNRRRWRNFKSNRRGYWSLIIFLVLFVFALFAEVIANDKPLLAFYKGEVLFPVLVDYPESKFGGFLAVTDYKDPVILEELDEHGWAIWPPISYSYRSINKDYPRVKNATGQCLGFPGPPPWATRPAGGGTVICRAGAPRPERATGRWPGGCPFRLPPRLAGPRL